MGLEDHICGCARAYAHTRGAPGCLAPATSTFVLIDRDSALGVVACLCCKVGGCVETACACHVPGE